MKLCNQILVKWNVMPLLLGGSNFYFFTDLLWTRIGLNVWFALPTREGGKKGHLDQSRCKRYMGVFSFGSMNTLQDQSKKEVVF